MFSSPYSLILTAPYFLFAKVGITGKPKLEKDTFDFDHTFGPNSTNEQIYRAIGRPLVARAMGGQV